MDKISSIETRKFAFEQTDRRLGRMAFEITRVVRSQNPDAVHDLRVAVRRFSQTLRVFKPCFRSKEKRKIRRDLKRIMVTAGEVRNCDVALKLLSKSRQVERTDVRPKIQSRRRECARELAATLRNWLQRKSSRKWRSELETAITETDQALHRVPITKTAQRLLPGLAKDFLELGNRAAQAKTSLAELHQFRIASKKFRYSLEVFIPLYGPSLKPGLEAMKHVQGLLGDINDCETLLTMISKSKRTEGIVAWLRKSQRRRIAEFQNYWGEAFGAETTRRGWIDYLSHTVARPREVRKPAARTEAPSQPLSQSRAAIA